MAARLESPGKNLNKKYVGLACARDSYGVAKTRYARYALRSRKRERCDDCLAGLDDCALLVPGYGYVGVCGGWVPVACGHAQGHGACSGVLDIDSSGNLASS